MKNTIFFALIAIMLGLGLFGCASPVGGAENETKKPASETREAKKEKYQAGQVLVPWTRDTFRAHKPLPFAEIDLEYMVKMADHNPPYSFVNMPSGTLKVWHRIIYIRDPENPEAYAEIFLDHQDRFGGIEPHNVSFVTPFDSLVRSIQLDNGEFDRSQFFIILSTILHEHPEVSNLIMAEFVY